MQNTTIENSGNATIRTQWQQWFIIDNNETSASASGDCGLLLCGLHLIMHHLDDDHLHAADEEEDGEEGEVPLAGVVRVVGHRGGGEPPEHPDGEEKTAGREKSSGG